MILWLLFGLNKHHGETCWYFMLPLLFYFIWLRCSEATPWLANLTFPEQNQRLQRRMNNYVSWRGRSTMCRNAQWGKELDEHYKLEIVCRRYEQSGRLCSECTANSGDILTKILSFKFQTIMWYSLTTTYFLVWSQ